jgi:lysophospholipase L1-like esterase
MKSRHVITLVILILVIIGAGYLFGRYHGQKSPVVSGPTVAGSYIALGDSVAAGLGLKTYSDSSACDRTEESYPHLVAANLNLNLTSFACSGATTQAGLIGSQTVNQLDVKAQQTQAFALSRPTLISATIGANDLGWTDLFKKCYVSTCGTDADTALVTTRLASMSANLKTFLTNVQTRYGATPPHVILTGYYQIFPATKPTCPSLSSFDDSELAWTRAQQTRLNGAISEAVSGFGFAKYASVDFTGHELCTPNPWIQDTQSVAAFHPTIDGEPAFASAIERANASFAK